MTVDVVRQASPGYGVTGLNLVHAIVERRAEHGDCFYLDRGASLHPDYRWALYCNSLKGKGWEWDLTEYVKRPASGGAGFEVHDVVP